MRHEERERMSDNDPTKDISAKYDTKPTFETILEELRSFRASVELRFDQVDKRFDQLDVRLHRIEADGHDTQSKFHSLRADFNELRNTLKEHFPVIH